MPEDPVALVSAAHALQSMRASDFDACSAYGEVVDNSVQAEAKRIAIHFHYGPQSKEPLEYVAFGDDGIGMSPEVLHRCLQLGYSTRLNDRSGIGRFGVGATLAAINQCKRVELYSREPGKGWFHTHIDLDEIRKGAQVYIPEPFGKAPPPELAALVGVDHGTLVVWRKHDKQDTRGSHLADEMRVWAGRTYRHFIWDGVGIEINGQPVDAIDPLYARTDSTQFPGDPKALEYAEQFITWPVATQFEEFDAQAASNSQIRIRMSLLPKELRQARGSGNLQATRDRHIDMNEGLSIVRNGREVFYGTVPHWPGKEFKEIDRWWGAEISFEAILDYSFSVKNIKRGAIPLRELKKAISDKVEPTRKTALEEVRNLWNETEQRESADKDTRRHKKAEGVAKAKDSDLPKGEIDRDVNPEEAEREFTEEYLRGKSDDEKARWRELFRSQPFTIEDDDWKGAEFVDVKHLGGRHVMLYNGRHLFHQVLASLESQLGNEAGGAVSLRLRALIDLLLISYSRAEASFPAENAALLEQLRMHWGNFLLQYVSEWQKENDHDE